MCDNFFIKQAIAHEQQKNTNSERCKETLKKILILLNQSFSTELEKNDYSTSDTFFNVVFAIRSLLNYETNHNEEVYKKYKQDNLRFIDGLGHNAKNEFTCNLKSNIYKYIKTRLGTVVLQFQTSTDNLNENFSNLISESLKFLTINLNSNPLETLNNVLDFWNNLINIAAISLNHQIKRIKKDFTECCADVADKLIIIVKVEDQLINSDKFEVFEKQIKSKMNIVFYINRWISETPFYSFNETIFQIFPTMPKLQLDVINNNNLEQYVTEFLKTPQFEIINRTYNLFKIVDPFFEIVFGQTSFKERQYLDKLITTTDNGKSKLLGTLRGQYATFHQHLYPNKQESNAYGITDNESDKQDQDKWRSEWLPGNKESWTDDQKNQWINKVFATVLFGLTALTLANKIPPNHFNVGNAVLNQTTNKE